MSFISTNLALLAAGLLVGVSCQLAAADDGRIELDLQSTPDGRLFYVEIDIGEADNRQPFNLMVSLWPLIWVPSTQVSESRGYKNKTTVKRRKKTTTTIAGVEYKYRWHRDTWQLGSSTFAKLPFAVFEPVSIYDRKVTRYNIDGCLGLGLGPSHSKGLVQVLAERQLISKHQFSLYFNKTASDARQQTSQTVGKLILGPPSQQYYTGPVTYIGMGQDHSPEVQQVSLDWSRVDRVRVPLIETLERSSLDLKPARLMPDPTTIRFAGPRRDLDRIHLDFLGARRIFRNSVYAFADCRHDNKPDIVFSLGANNFTFTLRPSDYIIATKINQREVCLSALKPIGGDIWLFGTQFIRNYYTIFDFEEARFGLAQLK